MADPTPGAPADDWSARLLHGDSVDLLAGFASNSIDAVVCDPPYGLEFMGKEWDTFRADDDPTAKRWRGERSGAQGGVKDVGRDGFGRVAVGGGKRTATSRCETCGKRDAFRNKRLCGDAESWVPELVHPPGPPPSSVAFQRWCEVWAAAVLRVLKPGGHLLAFGGTRTYHRLTSGIEDAGFDIRDSIHWMYGQGFPKSLDVSKSIDARLGAEREVIGHGANYGASTAAEGKVGYGDYAGTWDVTAPASDEARAWRGWGTALKPAHEPAVLARKPFAGTVADNVLAHGVGALNTHACRVGSTGGIRTLERSKQSHGATDFPARPSVVEHLDAGRWPSNVVLQHLEECRGSGARHTAVLCAPGCPVALVDEASRGAASFFYVAKPSGRERHAGSLGNDHPTVKPLNLMRYLVRLVTPPGGVVLDPFLGSGTTGCAAIAEGFRFVGIERDRASFETALSRISDYAFAHNRPRPTSE